MKASSPAADSGAGVAATPSMRGHSLRAFLSFATTPASLSLAAARADDVTRASMAAFTTLATASSLARLAAATSSFLAASSFSILSTEPFCALVHAASCATREACSSLSAFAISARLVIKRLRLRSAAFAAAARCSF